jgi:uncharacterized protein YjbI with pentapeptide repeats
MTEKITDDQIQSLDRIRPIPWWVASVAVFGVLATIMATYVLVRFQIPDASQSDEVSILENAKLRISAVRYALASGAGAVGVLALLLAFHRQRQVERQQQHKELESESIQNDAQQRRITELRIKAVEQLGSESPAVRIGGLHNLERLGELHPELRQIVLDEICAYLRMPRARSESEERSRLEEVQLALIGSVSSQEQHVRLVAQDILQRHLKQTEHPEDFWKHTRVNLSGAVLVDIDFKRADLRNANFSRAVFIGKANFEAARFLDDGAFTEAKFLSNANFSHAAFDGNAQFQRVEFLQSTVFHLAQFNQDALFMHSLFNQDAVFSNAEFSGRSYFNSVRFEFSTAFQGARFDGIASFHGTRVKKTATFKDVRFKSHVLFMEALFGGATTFINAEFTADADTNFDKSVFYENSDFTNTSFNGPETFIQARFSKTYAHTLPSGWNMISDSDDSEWCSIQIDSVEQNSSLE